MMKRLFLPLCCLAAVCLAGCGIKVTSNANAATRGRHTVHPSGIAVTETRKATGFSGISAASGIQVSVAQSDSWKIAVTADENVMRFVSTEVRGGILYIKYADNISINSPTETRVKVGCPLIRSLSVSSSAGISLDGVAEGQTLEANASSAGTISGTVNYDKVSLTASSNARIFLDEMGEGQTLQANASSGGTISGTLHYDNVGLVASSNARIFWDGVAEGQTFQANASSGAIINGRLDYDVVKVIVSSNATVSLDGMDEGKTFQANVSSAGTISGTLYYDNVTLLASSNARADLSGKCAAYKAKVSSGAKATAAELLSEKAYVDVSNNAKATISASSHLQANASSGGSVIYYGNPYQIDKETSSGGSIKRGE